MIDLENNKDCLEVWDWRGYAKEFCDLILTGGDIQKFWDELLPDSR